MNLSEVLKTKMAPLHETLDHAPLLSEVMSPALTLSDYAKLISKMTACFKTVELAILENGGAEIFKNYFYDSRIEVLRTDQASLNADETEAKNLMPTFSHPQSAAVGMLYVLHGSSMGGTFIAKKLKDKVPENALHFYSQSEKFIPGWKKFKEKLDDPNSHLSESSVIAGANFAFGTFSEIFNES
jgi:heme oxygenase